MFSDWIAILVYRDLSEDRSEFRVTLASKTVF
jgi:hypothetical protein